ncbi:Uma2 family endonuclease [Lichenicoccus sp.]|uniref:Uma2 family endonuclease n=1 Tax=Lichenicoccus sp. TaxID=2781899 RepID=UPI003D0D8847
MSIALRKPMTQDEFFDWAEAQDERYEFDGFQPVAMTGGSGNHARITRNINLQLSLRLEDSGPCEALASDAGVQTEGKTVRYPDGVVTCSPFDGRNRLVPNPVIVIEVVSPSSVREDRIIKPDEYAVVPSIKRYVIVEQTVIGLTVLWRENNEPWHFQTLKAGDTLALPEITAEIPVDSLYARVNFDELGEQ